MHCSSCGQAIVEGLSYCKHCGARVDGAKEHNPIKLPEASLNVILGGILGIPIAGLGIVIGLMSVMKKELGFSNSVIIIVTFLSFLLLLAAEAALIWLLLQTRTRTVRETGDGSQLTEVVTKELGEAQVRELYEPVPSVTENTTRPFEPVHREPKRQ